MKTTSTDIATRSTSASPRNPAQDNSSVTIMEAPKSPIDIVGEKRTTSQATHYENCAKKKGAGEEYWTKNATEATVKAAQLKRRLPRPLS